MFTAKDDSGQSVITARQLLNVMMMVMMMMMMMMVMMTVHMRAAADAVRSDMIAELLQKRQEHDIRELNIALNEFRMLHQQPSSRREWDLYDPDALKKDRPARVSDDDPRCGISSLQKFDGEDLNNKARSKFMEEQRRLWAEQQMREHRQVQTTLLVVVVIFWLLF